MGHRILILSVGAGNGHNRAAAALQKAFEKSPEVETAAYIDSLEYTPAPFRNAYSKQFLKLVEKAPTLWGWAFDRTDVPWEERHLREILENLHTKKLKTKIAEFAPTACVCTHFMPAAIVARRIGKGKIRTHLSIVVTDYYVHASWLTDTYCRYFVAHEEGRQQLLSAGMHAERINVTGIPIDPVFSENSDRQAAGDKLGIKTEKPIVLMSAGAAGSFKAEQMISILSSIKSDCSFAIICGRNDQLKEEIQEIVNGRSDSGRFIILGYTNRMHDWMEVSDLFIGKPGGLTTSECLAKSLPMIIWEPIPGQEIYNAVYLLENGAGIAPTAACTLGFKVDQILSDPDRLKKMRENAASIGKARAAVDISGLVLENISESPMMVNH